MCLDMKVFYVYITYLIEFSLFVIIQLSVKDLNTSSEISDSYTYTNDLQKIIFFISVFFNIIVYAYILSIQDSIKRTSFVLINKAETSIQTTNGVLQKLIPQFIIPRIKQGLELIADEHQEVTVLFCDIYDFDDICATYTPPQLIDLLNEIQLTFDQLCENCEVEKIETVGKTYMACGGMFQQKGQKKQHADQILRLAFNMLKKVQKITLKNGNTLQIKIGIHSGPVIAGVVGDHKPQFALVGNTVNTSSRMCSNAKNPMDVRISEETYNLLQVHQGLEFNMEELNVKGLGLKKTFLVRQVNKIKNEIKTSVVRSLLNKALIQNVQERNSTIKQGQNLILKALTGNQSNTNNQGLSKEMQNSSKAQSSSLQQKDQSQSYSDKTQSQPSQSNESNDQNKCNYNDSNQNQQQLIKSFSLLENLDQQTSSDVKQKRLQIKSKSLPLQIKQKQLVENSNNQKNQFIIQVSMMEEKQEVGQQKQNVQVDNSKESQPSEVQKQSAKFGGFLNKFFLGKKQKEEEKITQDQSQENTLQGERDSQVEFKDPQESFQDKSQKDLEDSKQVQHSLPQNQSQGFLKLERKRFKSQSEKVKLIPFYNSIIKQNKESILQKQVTGLSQLSNTLQMSKIREQIFNSNQVSKASQSLHQQFSDKYNKSFSNRDQEQTLDTSMNQDHKYKEPLRLKIKNQQESEQAQLKSPLKESQQNRSKNNFIEQLELKGKSLNPEFKSFTLSNNADSEIKYSLTSFYHDQNAGQEIPDALEAYHRQNSVHKNFRRRNVESTPSKLFRQSVQEEVNQN